MATAAPSFDVFHAIADGNRRKLLDLLVHGEHSVRDLVAHFEISFAAVSQHLAVLRAAGLVTRQRAGRRQIYRLEIAALSEVRDWLAYHDKFWTDGLDRLDRHLAIDGQAPSE
jgi:DNA-binding transcriptional ArsR family regulator